MEVEGQEGDEVEGQGGRFQQDIFWTLTVSLRPEFLKLLYVPGLDSMAAKCLHPSRSDVAMGTRTRQKLSQKLSQKLKESTDEATRHSAQLYLHTCPPTSSHTPPSVVKQSDQPVNPETTQKILRKV